MCGRPIFLHMTSSRARGTLALLCAALVGGCGLSRSEPSSITTAASTRSALTDGNVAATLIAANTADILAAELALAKSRDADVRSFATMLRTDHSAVTEATTTLMTRLKVTPTDEAAAHELRDTAAAKRLAMRDLEGFAFDTGYVASEVRYHRSLLATIDEVMLPGAQHPELRALLVRVRPANAAHLSHAVALWAKLIARDR